MTLSLAYRWIIGFIAVIPWSTFMDIVAAVRTQEIIGKSSALTGEQKKAAVVAIIKDEWPAAARFAGLLNDLAWLWCLLKGYINRKPATPPAAPAPEVAAQP